MIRLELSPLGAVVLGVALVVLPLICACLAARWTDRKHRRDASPPTTTAVTQAPDSSIDAAWMRSQVQALLRSQTQLHSTLNEQGASLARINDQLSQRPPCPPFAPAGDTPKEAAHPNPIGTTAAAPSVPRSARAGPLAGAPAPRSVPISARARAPDAMPMPRRRPEPRIEAAEPERELSDEEIDALPPELPAAAKQRKRLLSPPKKPTLQNL